MKGVPASIDLSLLSFLEHGDLTAIAREEQAEGRKTDASYVGKVCKGKHRNDRILQRAFQIALQRKAKYPQQAVKS